MTIHIGKWYVPRQLLQSCQGCVPSTTNSISMLSPSRNVLMQNRLSHSKIELPPPGEGWGGASSPCRTYRLRRSLLRIGLPTCWCLSLCGLPPRGARDGCRPPGLRLRAAPRMPTAHYTPLCGGLGLRADGGSSCRLNGESCGHDLSCGSHGCG